MNTDKIRIREFSESDTSEVIRIDAIHSGSEKPDYWKERLKFFSGKSKTKLTLGYIAEIENQVAGYVLAEGRALEFGSPLCGWIFAIAIDPEYGRQGVALSLCREVCLKFKTLGIHTIRTLVRKDDVAILSFFRASGFRAGPFMELELEL